MRMRVVLMPALAGLMAAGLAACDRPAPEAAVPTVADTARVAGAGGGVYPDPGAGRGLGASGTGLSGTFPAIGASGAMLSEDRAPAKGAVKR